MSFPYFLHIIYGSSEWPPSVLVLPWKVGNYLEQAIGSYIVLLAIYPGGVS